MQSQFGRYEPSANKFPKTYYAGLQDKTVEEAQDLLPTPR
jgi:hypothetical protein